MLRVVGILVVLVLAVLYMRFADSTKKETAPVPASKLDIIRAYHETGGEEADTNLRYVAGYCASEQLGGKAPDVFRETIADVFIDTLNQQEGKRINPETLVNLFVERRTEQVPNYQRRMETPAELIMITKFFKAWQRKPERFPRCIHTQLEGRGYLTQSGA